MVALQASAGTSSGTQGLTWLKPTWSLSRWQGDRGVRHHGRFTLKTNKRNTYVFYNKLSSFKEQWPASESASMPRPLAPGLALAGARAHCVLVAIVSQVEINCPSWQGSCGGSKPREALGSRDSFALSLWNQPQLPDKCDAVSVLFYVFEG